MATGSPVPTRAPFAACGVVTLTTDFGLADPYAGLLHAVILTRAPAARVVDLTHGVPPQDVRRASYFLAHAWGYFPPGSVHLAVVDPGVGSPRRLLVAQDQGHCFLAPDNGLLAPVLSAAARVRVLDVARFAVPGASRTFHGRDVLAPAAAAIAAGLEPAAAGLGPELEIARTPFARARLEGDRAEAEVLFADHYGNLVLSARGEDLGAEPRCWRVHVRDREIPVHGTYADVAPGALLALVDSFGALEIAERDGSAAQRLHLAAGDRVTLQRTR